MANSAGITVSFSKEAGLEQYDPNKQYSGRAFRVLPEGEITPGTRVTFIAYGAKYKLISGLDLFATTWKLTGTAYVRESDVFSTERLDFSGASSVNLKYPVEKNKELIAIAQTPIMQVDKTTGALSLFAAGGSRLNRLMDVIGYSGYGIEDENIALYGSIKIRYCIAPNIKYWRWTAPNRSGDYYFYMVDEDGVFLFSHKITITVESVDAEGNEREYISPIDVVVVVKEYTSNCPVEGATVYIDGLEILSRKTDENGSIHCGRLTGGRHTIMIKKDGYVDSDQDDLENDSFVIGAA